MKKIDPAVVRFILKQFVHGTPAHTIRSELQGSGWRKEDIEATFKQVAKELDAYSPRKFDPETSTADYPAQLNLARIINSPSEKITHQPRGWYRHWQASPVTAIKAAIVVGAIMAISIVIMACCVSLPVYF
jgi:hypothetical protein